MRRTLGFILPLLVTTGCFLTGNRQPDAVDAGPPLGERDKTLEYWGKLRGVMGERSKSDELRALTKIVQKQVDVIHNEPTEGVDTELVAAAAALAKAQEKVIEVAEIANYQLAGLRASPPAAKQFVEANQQAAAAAARVKALRAKLAARYGIAFPATEG